MIETESERADRIWGEGNWVHCLNCPATDAVSEASNDRITAWHHKDYHSRRTDALPER